MINLNFEFVDGKIHILDYPNANQVLELPNTNVIKQLKDMLLHQFDLGNAVSYMQALEVKYNKSVKRALIQSAIIDYYKCFGSSKFRNHNLDKKKVLAGLPAGAVKVFDYYKTVRDKFVAHDESRYTQVFTGAILETGKQPPFVDIAATVSVADILGNIKKEELQSLFNLISVTREWVNRKVDELFNILIKDYMSLPLSDYASCKPLVFKVPSNDDIFIKRY